MDSVCVIATKVWLIFCMSIFDGLASVQCKWKVLFASLETHSRHKNGLVTRCFILAASSGIWGDIIQWVI